MSTVRRMSILVVLAGLFAVAGLGDAPAQTRTKPAPKSATRAGGHRFDVPYLQGPQRKIPLAALGRLEREYR